MCGSLQVILTRRLLMLFEPSLKCTKTFIVHLRSGVFVRVNLSTFYSLDVSACAEWMIELISRANEVDHDGRENSNLAIQLRYEWALTRICLSKSSESEEQRIICKEFVNFCIKFFSWYQSRFSFSIPALYTWFQVAHFFLQNGSV